jgi:hypothetical protein
MTLSRRGFALLLALLGLLIIGLMVSSLFHTTLGESRRLTSRHAQTRVDAAADDAAYRVMRDWIPGANDSLVTGDRIGGPSLVSGNLIAQATTTRLSPALWWTVSTATIADSSGRVSARRSVNVAWRTTRPDPIVRAALTARDSVSVTAGGSIVGTDSSAIAWSFCPAPAGIAGVALADTTRLCDGTCGSGAGTRVLGAPPLIPDTIALDTLTYASFGLETWASLVAMADVTLPPGTVLTPAPVISGGQCDRVVSANWGDPFSFSPCSQYAPILHAMGDLEMRGGVGQGILLVEGDLVMTQGARFSGLVLTNDDLIASGTAEILGAVLARDRRPGSGDHTRIAGSARVHFSSCALEAAFRRSGRLVPLRERGWAVVR